MKCHHGFLGRKCAKEAHFVVTTKDRMLDAQIVAGQVYCLKHAREVFRSDCACYGRDVITRIWKVEELASNQRWGV